MAKKLERNTGRKRTRVNASSRKRPRRRRRKRGIGTGGKVLIALLVGLACMFILLIAYIADKMNKLESDDIKQQDIVMNDLAEGVGEGFTNFALFGGDSRTGEMDIGVLSDSIIIASLNNKTREVKMVSVYRDTLLDLSDGTYQKCNAAYSFGGAKQAIDMLNMNLDLEIEDYVTVDFGAISDVIDLLGGVEIEVSEAELPYLNKFMGETAMVAGKEAIEVKEAGMQTLDGVQATTYARIRSTKGGDFKRAERQRYVIEKMVEKTLKSDLGTINKIIDAVLPKIRTSLSATEILNYAKSFNKYQLGDNIGFPMRKTTDTLEGLGSIVIPVSLEENVMELHRFLYGDEDYEPSVKVQSISSKIEDIAGPRTADSEVQWEVPSDKKQNSTQLGN